MLLGVPRSRCVKRMAIAVALSVLFLRRFAPYLANVETVRNSRLVQMYQRSSVQSTLAVLTNGQCGACTLEHFGIELPREVPFSQVAVL